MPSALPDGEPAPLSGELPGSALSQLPGRPFGIYVHVPFCSVRCGYCDFNTYTLTELGVDGASVASYADAALAELDLATLERTHAPANVRRAVEAARAAGLKVSVDLIYGTPGESLQDWRESLAAAIALEPDHISAYALVVEQGTKLAAQVRRGQVPAP